MNQTKVSQIRRKLEAALAELGKEFGGEFTIDGSIVFDPAAGAAKFKLAFAERLRMDELEGAATFRINARKMGIDPEAFGRVFRSSYTGDEYRICGLRPRAPKLPVIAKCIATGQEFVFPRTVLANAK